MFDTNDFWRLSYRSDRDLPDVNKIRDNGKIKLALHKLCRECFVRVVNDYYQREDAGEEKIIVLKGNHEVWFGQFLYENEDVWLAEDNNFSTSGTFLEKGQLEELKKITDRNEQISYIKKCIKNNHKDLLAWMQRLKPFYETETQIFVHAGVDEDIPVEELDAYELYELLEERADYSKRYYPDESTYLVTGHTPTFYIQGWNKPEVYRQNGHIAIDCGCVGGGKLAAFCIETEEVTYVEGRKLG